MIQSMASFRQVCIRHSGGKNLHLEVGKLGGDWNFRWKLPPFKGYIKALYTYDHMYTYDVFNLYFLSTFTYCTQTLQTLISKKIEVQPLEFFQFITRGETPEGPKWLDSVLGDYGCKVFRLALLVCCFCRIMSCVSSKASKNYIYVYMHVQFIIAWIWHLSIDKKTPLLCLLKSSQAMKRRGFPGSQDSAGGLLKQFDLWWLRTTKDHDFPCHVLVCVQAEHIGT